MSMTTGNAWPGPGSSEDAHARLARHLESLVYAEPRSREAREAAGLNVMRGLLERLGNPHVGLNLVHVAGSKGKGSTVLAAEAVLRAAGETVRLPGAVEGPQGAPTSAAWVRDHAGPDTPLHFTRFHPDYQLRNLPPTPVATDAYALGVVMWEAITGGAEIIAPVEAYITPAWSRNRIL